MELSTSKVNLNPINIKLGELKLNLLFYILGAIIISCYYFPFGFTFIPEAINTKIILAIIGIPLLALNYIKDRFVTVEKKFGVAILIAIIFSVVGHISVDLNNSSDYTYANYIISFSVWSFGAYTVCTYMRNIHGYFNFTLLFNYLIIICVAQCFLALIIDRNIAVQNFVDAYISQSTVAELAFLKKVERLYGIGAALDVAGTRFSIVLLGLAVLIVNNINKSKSKNLVIFYSLSFFIITILGNIISRTTIIGAGLALIYFFSNQGFLHNVLEISITKARNIRYIIIILILITTIAVYKYITDISFQGYLQFAFEGFFNLVEKGEWTTSSTEKLNNEMWIWPEATDYRTWLIGKGLFDGPNTVRTDIGYCRFVFYNGLAGLLTFSIFFMYNAYAMMIKFPNKKLFFFLLLSLTFIIWLKVATDLFIIYALFYCLDKEEEVNV